MYCDFKDTGNVFRNKKVYKCSHCGLTLGLENPDAKIICFPYARSMFNQAMVEEEGSVPQELIVNNQDEADILVTKLHKTNQIRGTSFVGDQYKDHSKPDGDHSSMVLCTDKDIEARLAICNKCEYYRDNSCLLCGCAIAREKNYKNKLANANAQCPDGRWGPIKH